MNGVAPSIRLESVHDRAIPLPEVDAPCYFHPERLRSVGRA